MNRRHLMTMRLLLLAGDALGALLVFFVVSSARFQLDPNAIWSVGIDVGPAAFIFAATWVSVSWAVGLYHLGARWSLAAEARDVIRAALTTGVLALSVLFLLHQDNVSRVFLGLLIVVQPVVSIALRGVLRGWFHRLRRRGYDLTHMIVVGTGELAQDFADQVESHPGMGITVIGHLTVPGAPPDAVTRPILGSVDGMSDLFRSTVIDEVAVCLPGEAGHYLEPVIAVAADEGKTVRVPRDPEDAILSGALQEDLGRFLVRSIVNDGQRELERALKRVIDAVGASIGLVILSPLIGASALLIRIRDGSPVFFRQTRVGLHGRPFTIYKFRTMSVDAEDRFAEVAAHSDTQGAAFKMDNDPRCTPTGRFLRKWTLDELPQLFNVLTGDMSLVGPRPAPPREVDAYDIWHRRRLSVRPGMTGLWQVEARFDQHFDDRAELDLRYIDHWSLWMDLAILVKTLPAVLSPRGR